MGVTLERVQNKFACIIGELCNEPYVLSQFAIWVDLRIAEYKANGAISLDCTGDNPHPTWLKGMNPPKSPIPNRSVNQSGRRHGIYESSGNPTSANESCELSFDSGEFEIIEVKEEPPDFPSCTSFKSHGRLSPTRKRTSESQDFLQSDNSIFPTSPPKSRKLSTASDNNELSGVGQDTVSHQSFMSVIGLADHSAHSVDNLNPSSGEKSQFSNFDQSKGSNPGNIPFEDVAVHPSISTDEVTLGHMQWRRQVDEAQNYGGYRYQDSQHSQLSFKGERANMNNIQRGYNPSAIQGLDSNVAVPLGSQHAATFPSSSGRNVDLTFGTNYAAFPSSRNTAVNTKSAVSIFERWAHSLERPELRRIEDIPVEELDVLLVEFWKNVRQKNGSDYHPKSLIQLRTRLEWHLRSCQYPVSIVNRSIGFFRSISCFKDRIRYLNSLLSETENSNVLSSPPLHVLPSNS